MVLFEGCPTQNAWCLSRPVLQEVTVHRIMSKKFSVMVSLPVYVQPVGCSAKHGAQCTSVMEIGEQLLVGCQCLDLSAPGKLHEFLDSETMFHFFQVLRLMLANVHGVIFETGICGEGSVASVTCWQTIHCI